MPQAEVNWLAILVSNVIYLAIGFVWYSPALFGNKWIALSKVDVSGGKEAMAKEMPKMLGGQFVLGLLMFFVLACGVDYASAFTPLEGAVTAFWLWLGFPFSTAAVGYLYEKKSWTLLAINTGYTLVSLVIGGAILAVWI